MEDHVVCGTWHASGVEFLVEQRTLQCVFEPRASNILRVCKRVYTLSVAYKGIDIACNRNIREEHHVEDPCQSVEDEACDDLAGALVHSLLLDV